VDGKKKRYVQHPVSNNHNLPKKKKNPLQGGGTEDPNPGQGMKRRINETSRGVSGEKEESHTIQDKKVLAGPRKKKKMIIEKDEGGLVYKERKKNNEQAHEES